ncbi:phage tail family protein [Listeria innocua]|uniref:Phage tail protein n=1 Tax=Listeria immobilis TaxID=2713502 RepID=A0A7X0X599_9LIST|nr:MULTISPECIES: phage tail family protein [Listeria]EAE6603307.1 phage tail protein [Listeria monocytogenes]EHR9822509.1 phage tail family protein [Listeria innocua]EAE9846479.1 phage tail protein [Listeria monocytogenes]EAE9885628.1 phage tail protein [Listeria monocytogenes]EAF0307967.1 phage tail protein [Listeria monocytogenes]
MNYQILIDDTPCTDYGLCVTERPVLKTPEQDIEVREIRGRNGAFVIPYGFKNIEEEISFNFLDDTKSFKQLFREAKKYFMNGKKLVFSDDPHVYRKIVHVSFADAENTILEYGLFNVIFTLDPFQYINTSIIDIDKGDLLMNEGSVESQPYIKIFATGDVTLNISGNNFIFKGIDEYIELDCENLMAYKTVNDVIAPADDKMFTPDFPVLQAGENYFDWIGNVEKIEVNPYWRYV